jgi:hypothetical protein
MNMGLFGDRKDRPGLLDKVKERRADKHDDRGDKRQDRKDDRQDDGGKRRRGPGLLRR